jgi:uncharacterized membrane protein YGL010W
MNRRTKASLPTEVREPLLAKAIDDRSPSDLENNLKTLIRSTKDRLIANILINTPIRLFHLKDGVASALLVTLLWAISIYLIAAALNKVVNTSAGVFTPLAALASIIAAASLGVVKILHDEILPPNLDNLVAWPYDESGLAALHNWFESLLSMKKQLLTSCLLAVFAVVTLNIVERNTSAKFEIGTYLSVFSAMFSVGHGLYCAVKIPTLAKAATKQRMNLYWLDPANTPILKIASSAFAKLSIADGAIATLCIVALYWFRPWESLLVATISAFWLVAGLVAVTYSFVYPYHYITRGIKDDKRRQMSHLQSIIAPFRSRLDQLNEHDYKKLDELLKLYDRIATAKDSTLDIPALSRFFTSLVVPTLSFVIGLIDWKKLLNLP